MEDHREKNMKKIIIMILLIIIIILLYLLFHRFGNIEHHGLLVPTGNVDIFEINCDCDVCNGKDKSVFGEDDINKNKSSSKDIIVYDDYKIWDNKDLRIFSNPAYEYESIIAPGSKNTYAFVIRNNNYFDVVVDINFIEDNPKGINMHYKLSSKGKYIIGNADNYVKFTDYKIENITIPARGQIPYILDWKWVDSDRDTEIGFDITSSYKLTIQVGANEDI